jgi:predicted RNA-binding Zn-ribbon protein involved in translation (DUF1610 family)
MTIVPIDARGVETSACPICGGNIIRLDVIFDEDGIVSFYMQDAECTQCGTLLTPPMPEVGNVLYPVMEEL